MPVSLPDLLTPLQGHNIWAAGEPPVYVISYTSKSGLNLVGRAATPSEAIEKVRRYKAAGATDISVTHKAGQVVSLEDLTARAGRAELA